MSILGVRDVLHERLTQSGVHQRVATPRSGMLHDQPGDRERSGARQGFVDCEDGTCLLTHDYDADESGAVMGAGCHHRCRQ